MANKDETNVPTKEVRLIRFLLALQVVTLAVLALGAAYLYRTRWICLAEYSPASNTLSLAKMKLAARELTVRDDAKHVSIEPGVLLFSSDTAPGTWLHLGMPAGEPRLAMNRDDNGHGKSLVRLECGREPELTLNRPAESLLFLKAGDTNSLTQVGLRSHGDDIRLTVGVQNPYISIDDRRNHRHTIMPAADTQGGQNGTGK